MIYKKYMSKKYHYTYIITNLVNDKQYVGDHSTNNLEDGYMGSGKKLNEEKLKYGKENFKRKILEFFDTKEEAYHAQIKYIKLYKTHVSQGGYNKNWTGGQWASTQSEKTKRQISGSCKGKTSPKIYTLIDPNGKEYKNVNLTQICEEKNLNFQQG